MVEQTRRPSRVIALQAGPSEVDPGTLRISDRVARACGRQLALIGDQLDREYASRMPNQLPTPLNLLRPAQALTRTIYRDIHNQLGTFRGLSAAMKTWLVSTAPGQGILRVEALTAWASNFNPVTCTGWNRGALVTVALVAMVTIFSALWTEQKA
ncbi:bcl-2-interacting killer [Maylandia zebra]|nr:bcl-2-interacting killer [Neolamprologus brichardi]XP_042076388.1 bcl-2-interacting killer isoform X2 [Haplochromis burtoni]